MEKVIGEFKIIETEEGYRIEIKSDKEKMKRSSPGQGGAKSTAIFTPSTSDSVASGVG